MSFDPEKIRADFPPLALRFGGKPPVYLDNACVSLRPRQVIRACSRYYEEFPGCHGRSAHRFSRAAAESWEGARRAIAAFAGAGPDEIIFTRNATEGLNLAARSLGRGVVLTTELEHNSNLLPWLELARLGRVQHRTFPLNPDLTFSMDAFVRALEGVTLVSVPHRSHVTGCCLPLREIAEAAHARGALLLVDGAQALGPGGLDLRELGADFYAFSAHKMLGPAGLGALYARREKQSLLSPLLLGGGTAEDVKNGIYTLPAGPSRFEAGLQNYPAAEGLAAAAAYLSEVDAAAAQAHVARLNAIMTEKVLSVRGAALLGPADPALRGGVLDFTIAGADAVELAGLLEGAENIMVRAGRHCAHDWFNSRGIASSLRASAAFYNTEEEARLFGDTVAALARHFY